jgi:hypothetical protein
VTALALTAVVLLASPANGEPAARSQQADTPPVAVCPLIGATALAAAGIEGPCREVRQFRADGKILRLAVWGALVDGYRPLSVTVVRFTQPNAARKREKFRQLIQLQHEQGGSRLVKVGSIAIVAVTPISGGVPPAEPGPVRHQGFIELIAHGYGARAYFYSYGSGSEAKSETVALGMSIAKSLRH